MRGISIKPVAVGVSLALLALVTGEMHGMSFGALEGAIKEGFAAAAAATHPNDAVAADANAQDAWKYLKRAHEHFMGLGTAALALCLFTGLARAANWLKFSASTAVGLGAFLYPLFWSLTAIATPAAGGHAAKESLKLLAQAGAGLSFLGLLGVIVTAVAWISAGDGDR